MKKRKPEDVLVKRVSSFMLSEHPSTPFRFDFAADMKTSIGVATKNKAIHGKWNAGYPDMFICQATKHYGGLYVELKATKTVINSEHTRRQRAYHQVLRNQGYMVEFACGFEEAERVISGYLALKRRKIKKKCDILHK